jgi:hypothetical protein
MNMRDRLETNERQRHKRPRRPFLVREAFLHFFTAQVRPILHIEGGAGRRSKNWSATFREGLWLDAFLSFDGIRNSVAVYLIGA